MKLALTSAGLCSKDIADAVAKLVGKPLGQISVAVINEASAVEPGDKTWLIDELVRLRRFVGGEIDIISLLALDIETVRERARFADVIYVVGGNTDYLMSVYQKTGFSKLLKDELLRDKVYVGSSAGSMVLGRRISTNAYRKNFGSKAISVLISEYMSLVDFAIFPHLNSEYFTNRCPEAIEGRLDGFVYTVYAISDNQAIIVDDDKIDFIGSPPVEFRPKV